MARGPQKLAAPRISDPSLPDRLEPGDELRPRADAHQVRWSDLAPMTDAAHATISESIVDAASVDRLDLTGSVLTDVDLRDLRATELIGRTGRWRSVRVQGGRIGTLDLSNATLASVQLQDVRIDYLTLASSQVSDLQLTGCTIGTLDLPAAELNRVAFDGCRAEEVDNRGLRSTSVDLRGLDALAFTDPVALRGVTLTERQTIGLSGAFAVALGIDVRD